MGDYVSLSAIAEARARYGGYKDQASLMAVKNVAPAFGIDVRLMRWSNRSKEALIDQWGGHPRHEVARWDWEAVFRSFREPSAFDMVLWSKEDRLSALGLATLSGEAVTFRFIEGDPRDDCPCRGARIPIMLEATAIYAQLTGREQIRIEPANSALETLYKTVYGFQLATPKKGKPYLWLGI